MRAIILNRNPPPSSLFKYSKDLTNVKSHNSVLLNIVNDSSRWNNPHIGIDVKIPLGNNFYISGILSRFTYKNVIKAVNSSITHEEEVLLHMGSPFANPSFSKQFPITMTVHDSPKALFQAGLYRMGSESNSEYSKRMKLTRILYNKAMNLPYLCTNSKHVGQSIKEFGYDGEIYGG